MVFLKQGLRDFEHHAVAAHSGRQRHCAAAGDPATVAVEHGNAMGNPNGLDKVVGYEKGQETPAVDTVSMTMSCMRRFSATSSAVKGSSKNMKSGSATSARAMAVR